MAAIYPYPGWTRHTTHNTTKPYLGPDGTYTTRRLQDATIKVVLPNLILPLGYSCPERITIRT
jgi:hypothetical protein